MSSKIARSSQRETKYSYLLKLHVGKPKNPSLNHQCLCIPEKTDSISRPTSVTDVSIVRSLPANRLNRLRPAYLFTPQGGPEIPARPVFF